MINGDTFYVSDEVEEAFKLSGITHLLAVSGSNISFIIIATKFVFDKVFGKSISNFVSIFIIIIFVLICGASPSVVRSAIMAIILILSEILSKKPHTLTTIFITCLIMLLYNPFIICDVGFLLSFGGTLGIVLFSKRIQSFFQKNCRLLKFETLSVTLSAQIIIFPVMWYFFNSISIISIVTNLLVGPLVSFITIFGVIIYLTYFIYFPLSKLISYSTYILVHIVILVAKYLSYYPMGNLLVPTPSVIMIICYYLIVYYIFCKKCYKYVRYIIYILLFVIILNILIPNNYCEINFIDVGQGDAIHILTSHKRNILIDGGGSEQSDYDIGEKVLVPYLLDNSYGIIDLIIVSHFHDDHVEGLISVIEKLKVRNIIIGMQYIKTDLYKHFIEVASKKNIPIHIVKSKNSFTIDGLKFDVLYTGNIEEKNLNNDSLIVKVTINERKVLFTGDAEEEEESKVLELFNSSSHALDVDVLKVGHHGSRGSTTEEFLKFVKPEISVISCGVNNKFGHPHKETLKRINKYCKNIFRTDLSGEISIKIYKSGKIALKKLIN